MKISLDLDNVLCDFVATWNIWCYNKGLTKYICSTHEVTSYDWHKRILGEEVKEFFTNDTYDCYDHIRPFVGAKDFINYCIGIADDVEILSHSTSEQSSASKLNFCKEHFDFDNVKFSDSTADKYTQTQGRILIDDYPPSVLKHVAYNKSHGIVFDLGQAFGWSKLKDYKDMMFELPINYLRLNTCYNYEDVKKELIYIKEKENGQPPRNND
jgi:hypothetical protein